MLRIHEAFCILFAMSLFSYLTAHSKYGIRRGEVVIDIGSGNSPILRADVLVEKYIDTDAERYSGLVIDRPMICADGESLPFRDKSIDFLYCSHLLEHIPRPEAFLDEIQRVARRGVIITPHGDYEKIDPRRVHLWNVTAKDGKLRLVQKKCWNEYEDIRRYFYGLTLIGDYWKFYDRHIEAFSTVYPFEGKIEYEVERYGEFDYSRFGMAFSDEDRVRLSIDVRQMAKKIVSRVCRLIISGNDSRCLSRILACPMCRADLASPVKNAPSVACSSCGAVFPVRAGIPILLKADTTLV